MKKQRIKWYNEIIKINTKSLVLVKRIKDNKIIAHYYIDNE